LRVHAGENAGFFVRGVAISTFLKFSVDILASLIQCCDYRIGNNGQEVVM